MSEICHIVAVDKENCIGKGNALPWHIPSDLKYFKDCTRGFPIIMGRKTFESIGRPLPGRLNIVLTRDAEYKADGVELVSSLGEALKLAKAQETEKIFIIGGAQIYRQSLDLIDKAYITKVQTQIEEGDAFYPDLPESFKLISRNDSHDKFDLSFCVYSAT